jgi:hypothetical protein
VTCYCAGGIRSASARGAAATGFFSNGNGILCFLMPEVLPQHMNALKKSERIYSVFPQ